MLLERAAELEALEEDIGHAAAGAGRLVLIEGPPGVGKTSLLREAMTMAAAARMRVRPAWASMAERSSPYGVARQLLGPALAATGHAGGPPEREMGTVALPDRAAVTGRRDQTPIVLQQLLASVVEICDRGPLLLSLDDAGWADVPSLRLLGYLARRLDGLPLMVLIASRPTAADEQQAEQLMLARAARRLIEPRPLSERGTAEVLAHRLGEPVDGEFCGECHRLTGGNPLLVAELVRALAVGRVQPVAERVRELARLGGSAVGNTLRVRLIEVGPDAAQLARSAALLGDGAPLPVACELAELAPSTAQTAARRLREAQVIAPGEQVAFVHPLISEALRGSIEPLAAAREHARAAVALQRAGLPDAQVASHLLQAPPAADGRRVAILRRVAASTLAAGDAETTAAYLRRALAEPPPADKRLDVLLELAAAEYRVEGESAVLRLREALPLLDDPLRRARVACTLAAAMPCESGREAIEAALDAVDGLPAEEREMRLRLEATVAAAAALIPSEAALADRIAARLRAQAGGESTGARILACALAYRDLCRGRPVPEVEKGAERAFAGDWVTAADPETGPFAPGMVALIACDSPVAARAIEEWLALAKRRGSLRAFGGTLMLRAHLRLAHGELAEAAADAEQAVESMRAHGTGGTALAHAVAALAESRLQAGDPAGAARAIASAGVGDEEAGTPGLHGLMAVRARVRAAAGEQRGALEEMLALGRRFSELGGGSPALMPWRSQAALFAHALGDDEKASRLAAAGVERSRASGGGRALARALTVVAAVGPPQEAAEPAREALQLLDGLPAPLERARALTVLAAALGSGGSAKAARGLLRDALQLAARCGAGPLELEIRCALIGLGGRPRTATASGVGALTASERRVADLAAAGARNREIACQLHLTARTVEHHLTSTYRKLGIRSRSQLARALGAPVRIPQSLPTTLPSRLVAPGGAQ